MFDVLEFCDGESFVYLDLGLDPYLFGLCLIYRRTLLSLSFPASVQDCYLEFWTAC